MTDLAFKGSGTYARHIEQKTTLVKQALLYAQRPDIDAKVFYSGATWDNEFRLSDVEILLDYENPEDINAGHDDNDDGQLLAKPVFTISDIEINRDGMEPMLQTTISVLVNREPEGRLIIDGFTQLLCYVLDKEVFGWLWVKFGLLPHGYVATRVQDGEEIVPEIENRVLTRSVRCTFSVTGVSDYGPR